MYWVVDGPKGKEVGDRLCDMEPVPSSLYVSPERGPGDGVGYPLLPGSSRNVGDTGLSPDVFSESGWLSGWCT